MLAPGTTIERYEVVRLLGKGGMAAVYLVRHTQLASLHALKVLTLQQEGIRERMLQEGQLQARLKHRNIVEVRDVLDVDGSPGLLMEYVPGVTLEALLKERRLDYGEAERLFRGIVSGIAHAHAGNLVHRDLKPANVLLPEVDGELLPKVADFGLARLLGESSSGPMTQTGIVMGTPPYMSPEQIEDPRGVDHRADVFALGCILYEMVCGASPFRREQWMQTFQAVLSGSYPAPETLAPDLPRHLATVIEGCLRADRRARFGDCDAILSALDRRPTGASPPGRARLLPWLLAATGAGGAAIIVIVLLLGAAIWWTRRDHSARLAEAPPAATPPAETPPAETPPAATPPAETPPPAEAERLSPEPPVPAQPPKREPVGGGSPNAIAARPRPSLPAQAPPPAQALPPTPPAAPPATRPGAGAVAPTGPGRVHVGGDASNVWIVGGGKQHAGGGELPAGFYRIMTSFDGAEPILAGDLRLGAGESVTVTCSTATGRCQLAR